MSRFSKTYDHLAKEVLEQCGFKDHLFEEIAKNITLLIKGSAERQTLSQIIQRLEEKILNDDSGILLRFFAFTTTMTFVDFISREAIVNQIGKILENLPKDICMKCEHMKKKEDGEGYVCEKTLDECPFYLNLSMQEKEALLSIQPKSTE